MVFGDFQELQGAEARLFVARDAEMLMSIYASAQARLTSLLAGTLSDYQRWRFEQVLRQVDAEIAVLNVQARSWATTTIPDSYKRGAMASAQTLADFGQTVGEINFGNRLNSRAIKILADQATSDLLSANQNMKTQLTRYVRATQQTLVRDAAISKSIAEGVIVPGESRTIQRGIENQLRVAMGNSRYINVGGRNYTPEYYSGMVARTRLREASSNGTVMSCLEFGCDLVQVDLHPDACPICQTHMGRVYSISGTNPDFPPLETSEVPRHPHCLCSLVPAPEVALKVRGTYAALSALSMASPTVTTEKEAQAWLDKNQDKKLGRITDLQSWVNDYNTRSVGVA